MTPADVESATLLRTELPYECDLVLKGGVTSGIIYPPAIAEIARDHRLRSVGGASAGAIAAAAAAAAELGRETELGGFEVLKKLPLELKTMSGGKTLLQRLFSPPDQTTHLFDACWAAIRGRSTWARAWSVMQALKRDSLAHTRMFRPARWLPILVWLAVTAIAVRYSIDASNWAARGALGVLVIGATVSIYLARTVILAVLAAKRFSGALEDNNFGLVSGLSAAPGADGGLSTWLHTTLQRLAGRTADTNLVTYGDLADESVGVQLVTVTTNLTFGTSMNFPFHSGSWAYSPAELEKVLPKQVVQHLLDHVPARPEADDATDYDQRQRAAGELGLVLMPSPDDIPIVIGARISLSFPVMLSAMPLWTWTVKREDEGDFRLQWVRCWFSDGGITSNLPVFLFDKPLPNRPTYAFNLTPGGDATQVDPNANIYRPTKTGAGRLPTCDDITGVGSFVGAIQTTMQNWSDNALTRVVGQRDRICRIRLDSLEGGMNLDMPPQVIQNLADRGQAAGANLASIQRDNTVSRQWDRHQFARFRAFLAGVGGYLGDARTVWTLHPTYRKHSENAAASPPKYPYTSGWSRARHLRVWQQLGAFDDAAIADFSRTAPAGVRLGISVYDTAAALPEAASASSGDDPGVGMVD